MEDIIIFATSYRFLTMLLVAGNIIPAAVLASNLSQWRRNKVVEAMGGRNESFSPYRKCIMFAAQTVRNYEKREKKAGIYIKAAARLKKAGYAGEYAPAVYILLKYAAIPFFFLFSAAVNFPDIKGPAAVSLAFILLLETVIASRKRKMNLKLQRYIYKIYKYLHNQVSSGIKVTDAVRSVYEVIEDRELKDVLIRLAARYELTLDIDTALEEFRERFAVHEAETLCVALKQGVETGDNQEILARQEDVMFKKYFNYIQAETDGCKTRSMIAAAMFTAIVVIMIVVPLFNDASEAVVKIFAN